MSQTFRAKNDWKFAFCKNLHGMTTCHHLAPSHCPRVGGLKKQTGAFAHGALFLYRAACQCLSIMLEQLLFKCSRFH